MLLSYIVTDVRSHYLYSLWQMLLPFYDDLADVIANILTSGNFPLFHLWQML